MSCPDCLSGKVHDGHAKGKEIKLHGLDLYVTGASGKNSKGIVIVISDAFGWKLSNTRVWADQIAEKGEWRVLVPDFLNGKRTRAVQSLKPPNEANLMQGLLLTQDIWAQ